MLKVARSMKPMQTEEHLERWMARVVHTAGLDRFKAERRRSSREMAVGTERMRQGKAEDPAAGLELEERIAQIQALLEGLSEEDRALLRERFVEGKASSSFAVHGRIRRLLETLREKFDDAF